MKSDDSKKDGNVNNQKNAEKKDQQAFGILGTIVKYVFRFFRWVFR